MSNSYSIDCSIEKIVNYSADNNNTETRQEINYGERYFKLLCRYDRQDNKPVNKTIDYSKEMKRRFYEKVNGVIE